MRRAQISMRGVPFRSPAPFWHCYRQHDRDLAAHLSSRWFRLRAEGRQHCVRWRSIQRLIGRVGATLTASPTSSLADVRTALIQKFSGKMCADAAIRSIASTSAAITIYMASGLGLTALRQIKYDL